MIRKLAFAILILVAIVAQSACTNAGAQPPAPGPKIILKMDASGNLNWFLNASTTPLQPGASAILPTTPPTGYLRNDFSGSKIDDFAVVVDDHGTARSLTTANRVRAGKAGVIIELVRTQGDRARWFLTKNGVRTELLPTNAFNANEVPEEFVALDRATFNEDVEDLPAIKMDFFRVEVP